MNNLILIIFNYFRLSKNHLPITKECLYYMSPEVIRLLGSSKCTEFYSEASDVYSFGFSVFDYDFTKYFLILFNSKHELKFINIKNNTL
jgi:serine/threonine protein kinase